MAPTGHVQAQARAVPACSLPHAWRGWQRCGGPVMACACTPVLVSHSYFFFQAQQKNHGLCVLSGFYPKCRDKAGGQHVLSITGLWQR